MTSPLYTEESSSETAMEGSTDEIHQMFVPGREGKVFDVLIDSCGAFCGIMVSLITQKFIEKKKGNQI